MGGSATAAAAPATAAVAFTPVTEEEARRDLPLRSRAALPAARVGEGSVAEASASTAPSRAGRNCSAPSVTRRRGGTSAAASSVSASMAAAQTAARCGGGRAARRPGGGEDSRQTNAARQVWKPSPESSADGAWLLPPPAVHCGGKAAPPPSPPREPRGGYKGRPRMEEGHAHRTTAAAAHASRATASSAAAARTPASTPPAADDSQPAAEGNPAARPASRAAAALPLARGARRLPAASEGSEETIPAGGVPRPAGGLTIPAGGGSASACSAATATITHSGGRASGGSGVSDVLRAYSVLSTEEGSVGERPAQRRRRGGSTVVPKCLQQTRETPKSRGSRASRGCRPPGRAPPAPSSRPEKTDGRRSCAILSTAGPAQLGGSTPAAAAKSASDSARGVSATIADETRRSASPISASRVPSRSRADAPRIGPDSSGATARRSGGRPPVGIREARRLATHSRARRNTAAAWAAAAWALGAAAWGAADWLPCSGSAACPVPVWRFIPFWPRSVFFWPSAQAAAAPVSPTAATSAPQTGSQWARRVCSFIICRASLSRPSSALRDTAPSAAGPRATCVPAPVIDPPAAPAAPLADDPPTEPI
eukprot:scaffold16424_cov107-Isochrysis_galbana.AAC.7